MIATKTCKDRHESKEHTLKTKIPHGKLCELMFLVFLGFCSSGCGFVWHSLTRLHVPDRRCRCRCHCRCRVCCCVFLVCCCRSSSVMLGWHSISYAKSNNNKKNCLAGTKIALDWRSVAVGRSKNGNMEVHASKS